MADYNWRQFTKRITIFADAAVIFNAWTTQQGLESWFLRMAEFTKPDGTVRKRDERIQKDDQYKWLWFGYPDSTVEEQKVLFTNGENELEFRFSGGCIVNVKVTQENGETICELKQTMPMDNEGEQQYFFIECGKGWTFYMTNLKSILEGGIDLRNKNEGIQNVINA